MADRVLTTVDRVTPALRRAILAVFDALTGRVNLEDLARAVQTGRMPASLTRALDALPALVRAEVGPAVRQAVAAGARLSMPEVRRLERNLRTSASVPASAFAQVNARAVAAATRATTASLVRQTTRGMRQAIRDTIRAGVAGEPGKASITASAKTLRSIVGLDRRRASAVRNMRDRLVARGDDPARVASAVGVYAAKLHAQRARTIARTETMGSVQAGRLELWRAAAAQGLIPEGQPRQWQITDDDRLCPECEAMDGATAALDEPFVTPDGEELDGPPLHPSCRCTVNLALRE